MVDRIGLGTERTARLLSGRIWNDLTPLVSEYSSHISAAIAFVGTNGDQALPLRNGSSIVVNASERAVSAGSTDPRTLLKWVNAGVEVYSHSSLHAKLFVVDPKQHPSFVVVGSGNASGTSIDVWSEAALMTDSDESVRDARDYIIMLKFEAKRLLVPDITELIVMFDAARNAPLQSEPAHHMTNADDTTPAEPPPTEKVYRLFFSLVTQDLAMSAEAAHTAANLASMHDASYGGSLTPGRKFLYTYCDELAEGETAPISEGNHVAVILHPEGKRPSPHSPVYPPARVIQTLSDNSVRPRRVYYILLGQNSTQEPTLKDLHGAFQSLNLNLDLNSGYMRKNVIRTVMKLWPDLTHIRTD